MPWCPLTRDSELLPPRLYDVSALPGTPLHRSVPLALSTLPDTELDLTKLRTEGLEEWCQETRAGGGATECMEREDDAGADSAFVRQ